MELNKKKPKMYNNYDDFNESNDEVIICRNIILILTCLTHTQNRIMSQYELMDKMMKAYLEAMDVSIMLSQM